MQSIPGFEENREGAKILVNIVTAKIGGPVVV